MCFSNEKKNKTFSHLPPCLKSGTIFTARQMAGFLIEENIKNYDFYASGDGTEVQNEVKRKEKCTEKCPSQIRVLLFKV